jgi:predicted RNA-binding protein YlxR (DUF448 family)
VRLGDGSLALGRTLPGRGAWLCRGSVACVDQAQKRRAFDRAFRVGVSTRAVDGLRRELAGPTGARVRNVPESPVS